MKTRRDPNKPLQFTPAEYGDSVQSADLCTYDDINELIYYDTFNLCGCGLPDDSLAYIMTALKTITDEKSLKTNLDYFEALFFVNIGVINTDLELTTLGKDVIEKYTGTYGPRVILNTALHLDESIELFDELEQLGIEIQPQGWTTPAIKYIDALCLNYDLRDEKDYWSIPRKEWEEWIATVKKRLAEESGIGYHIDGGMYYTHYHILSHFNIDEHGGCTPGWIDHDNADLVKSIREAVKSVPCQTQKLSPVSEAEELPKK